MSFIPDTNYLIKNSEGIPVDISTIFNPGTCPTTTHLFFYNTTIASPAYVDLSTVINSRTTEIPVADTGYKITIGGVPTDLSQIFQPKITEPTYYTLTSTPADYNTKEVQKDGYYYIGFPYYTTNAIATITFNQNISNINVIVVGGGGCGREWSNFGTIRSGGGGGGGGVAQATFNAIAGDSYNISVGQGGQALGGGAVTSGLQTTFTSVTTPANNITCTGGQSGINDGSGTAIGGVGTVTGGIFTTIVAGTGGNGGQSLTSSSKGSINNGVSSAIPSLTLPAGTFPYGLGGGGGAGDWQTTGGTAGNGTGGICGAAPTGQGTTPTGYGCGGGGSASQVSNEYNTIGNNGLVLIYFNPTFSYTTNGIVSNSNPFVTSASSNGYTYILFNSASTNSFNITSGTIPTLYYMIVGLGGQAQQGATSNAFSAAGTGGGAGGCLNSFISNFSANNYTITIPAVGTALSTTLISNTFNLTAGCGGFPARGAVTLNGTTLSASSSVSGDPGVGGTGYSQNTNGTYPGSDGGIVYRNNNNNNNYIKFLGDELISNTLFGGGGGGGGAGNSVGINGYNGGGGGGGAAGVNAYTGGTGTNGANGQNSTANSSGGAGGNAFTASTTIKGYGGGGGGGGAGKYSANGRLGGTGGPAMLLLYF